MLMWWHYNDTWAVNFNVLMFFETIVYKNWESLNCPVSLWFEICALESVGRFDVPGGTVLSGALRVKISRGARLEVQNGTQQDLNEIIDLVNLGGKKIVYMLKMGGKTAAHPYWLSRRECPPPPPPPGLYSNPLWRQFPQKRMAPW